MPSFRLILARLGGRRDRHGDLDGAVLTRQLLDLHRADGHEGGRDRAVPVHLLEVRHNAFLAGQLVPALPSGSVRDQVRDFEPGLYLLFLHEIAVYFQAPGR